ncbi:AMP-binding protein [Parvularcula sp. ZS-1/3]|uniref:AMP-binding protein n=1 Tax=Parvularcula mediterranea TaxID=2732508 RepID=A0A7Y3RKE3_9PROT|nr:AMP-binding protein [Parvularcula mediterranea]NNU15679.1 AMP-binding protein [Parvularcula mediterranea]
MKPRIGLVAENSLNYIRKLAEILQEGVIAVPLRSKDDAERIEAAGVSEVRAVSGGGEGLPAFPASGDEPALINFTSGTEGLPKAIVISSGALANTVDRLIRVSGIERGTREYIGVPLHHSFGFGRCRVLAAVEGEAVLPEAGFDPNELAEHLLSGRVDAFSAVPSQLRIFLKRKELFSEAGPKVRFIEIGSQYMNAEEKRAVRDQFPNASITQHYGLTEASRTTFLRIDQTDGAMLESVGQALHGVEVRLSEGGLIEIRGPHLALGKLSGDRIEPLTDEEGWLRTSDLGRVEDEYLFFGGRADDLINCGGKKVSPEAIEATLASEYGLSGGFAIGCLSDPVYGERVLLLREASGPPKDALEDAATQVLNSMELSARSVLTFAETDELPRTQTGKIKRRELAGLVKDSPTAPQDPIGAILGDDYADTGISAAEAEIDSLQVLNLSMLLEERVGALPADWRTQSVRDLLRQEKGLRAEEAAPVNDGATNQNPKSISYWDLVREDLRTNDGSLLSYGFWALFWHRFGNWRMSVRMKLLRAPLTLLYRIMNMAVNVVCGIKLDYTVNVGRRVKIEHFGGMMLGALRIGDDVTIRQNTTFGVARLSDLGGKPIIESGVNIGAGVVIAGRVTVGRNSVIGPNCVVMTDVPAYSHVEVASPDVRPISAS